MDEQHERHATASRQVGRAVAPRSSVDPGAIVNVIDDSEKLIGWKQLTTKQRVGTVAALVGAIAALAVSIVTAVS